MLFRSTVEGICLLDLVPPQRWGQFESASNAVLFAAALFAGFQGLAVLSAGGSRGRVVLGNLTIPAAAFWINADVFGHSIRAAYLREDLWGLHAVWLLCAAVQVLALSGLGAALLGLARASLGLVRTALEQGRDLLRWGRDNVLRPVGDVISALPPAVRRMDGSLQAVLGVGTVLWLAYLAVQMRARGPAAVLADTQVLWHSLWLWLAVVTVCFLLRMIPPVCQQGVAAIRQARPRLVLAIVGLVIFVAVAGALPALLRTAAMVLLIPAAATLVPWLVYRRLRGRLQTAGGLPGTPGTLRASGGGVNQRDVLVLLLSFVALPLLIISLLTALPPDGTGDAEQFTSWMEFIKAAVETAKALLELLS